MENDKKECRAYFLERSVYKKLFAKIQEKYAGIGHFGGTFLLDDLTKEEKEQLGGFLQKDFSGQKNVRVTAKQMEKALQSSRFCNFTWEEILELYTGRALLVKKEEKQKEEQKRESWFQNIQLQLKNPDFRNWISEVLQNRKESYLFLLQQYKKTKKNWKIFCKRQTGQQKRWQRPKKENCLLFLLRKSQEIHTILMKEKRQKNVCHPI